MTAKFTFASKSEALARLTDLTHKSRETIYERVWIADHLLSDREWVESPAGGGGSYSKAIDRLQDDYFGEFCGAITLPQLIDLIQGVPDPAEWKRRKYNLSAMFDALKEAQKPAQQTRERTSIQDQLQLLRQENRQLKVQVRKLTRQNRALLKALQEFREPTLA